MTGCLVGSVELVYGVSERRSAYGTCLKGTGLISASPAGTQFLAVPRRAHGFAITDNSNERPEPLQLCTQDKQGSYTVTRLPCTGSRALATPICSTSLPAQQCQAVRRGRSVARHAISGPVCFTGACASFLSSSFCVLTQPPHRQDVALLHVKAGPRLAGLLSYLLSSVNQCIRSRFRQGSCLAAYTAVR